MNQANSELTNLTFIFHNMDIKWLYGFGHISKIFYQHICVSYACLIKDILTKCF